VRSVGAGRLIGRGGAVTATKTATAATAAAVTTNSFFTT
jgi:hypothetical protein